MHTIVDIETIPTADRKPFIATALDQWQPPSYLTKDQAAQELGLLETKNLNKEQIIGLWAEQFREQHAEAIADAAWRRTSLDGTHGRVLSIAWATAQDEPDGILNADSEPDLLQTAFDRLAQRLGARKPYWIGHCIDFDLNFLYRRAVIHGIKLPFELPFRGRHGPDFYCTSQAWCRYGERIKQHELSIALGLGGKGEMDGSKVCDAWLAGEFPKILAYNLDDVRQCRAIFRRQRFIAPLPRVAAQLSNE